MITNLTVLAVDDDQDDLDIFREALREIGETIKCIVALSGQEALHLLATLKKSNAVPDLIFLDHNMPGMNGTALLNEIKQDDALRNAQVIMYSTFFSHEDKTYYTSQGAMSLLKPDRFSLVIDALTGVIQKYAPSAFGP